MPEDIYHKRAYIAHICYDKICTVDVMEYKFGDFDAKFNTKTLYSIKKELAKSERRVLSGYKFRV